MPLDEPTLQETILIALQVVIAIAMGRLGWLRVSARGSRKARRRARRPTKNGKS